ncbi:hypothetical protein FS764_07785 [Agrobacterium vitis]|nr:hypothetical protein [Agrobacterium vitis]
MEFSVCASTKDLEMNGGFNALVGANRPSAILKRSHHHIVAKTSKWHVTVSARLDWHDTASEITDRDAIVRKDLVCVIIERQFFHLT